MPQTLQSSKYHSSLVSAQYVKRKGYPYPFRRNRTFPRSQQSRRFTLLNESSPNSSYSLEMGVNFPLLMGLIAIYFATLVRCTTPGFIFPANDFSSNATLSDIAVRFNDSMVIEYTPGVGEIVLLGQSCYNYSANPSDGSSENPMTFYLSSSCEFSSRTVLARFQNTELETKELKQHSQQHRHSSLERRNRNNGNYTGINFCQLTLQDFTIREYARGPFGLTSFNQVTSSE